jgi:ELWxxDGT repeat protein
VRKAVSGLVTGLLATAVILVGSTANAGPPEEPLQWVTDPPQLLKEITPGTSGSEFGDEFVTVGGHSFFAAGTGDDVELWVTDGTSAGTKRLVDINTGPAGSHPANLVEIEGRLVFFATDATGGREPWVSDGTAAGTMRLEDINGGPADGVGAGEAAALRSLDRLYFAGTDSAGNSEPWVTDGTPAGTTKLAEINADGGSDPVEFTAYRYGVLFSASTADLGREPYVSDGTPAGTHLLADVFPGPGSSDAHNFSSSGDGSFLFAAQSSEGNQELQQSVGPTGPVSLLKELNPGPEGSHPAELITYGDETVFVATNGAGSRELWITDRTPAGTDQVSELGPGADPRDLAYAFDGVNGFYFSADAGGTGRELWVLRGRFMQHELEAFRVADLEPGPGGSDPRQLEHHFEAYNVELNFYDIGQAFTAETSAAGRELWTVEGNTAASTSRRTDLMPGPGDGVVKILRVDEQSVIFVGDDGRTGPELYVTNLLRRLVKTPARIRLVAPHRRYSYATAARKRIKLVVLNTGEHSNYGRVSILERGKVVGEATSFRDRTVVRITKRLTVGRHRLVARFSGNYFYLKTLSKPVTIRVLPRPKGR